MSLPPEVLFHKFIRLFVLLNKDLRTHGHCTRFMTKTYYPITRCRNILSNVCSARFNSNSRKDTKCYTNLHQNATERTLSFTIYKRCLDSQMELLKPCVQQLEQHCKSKQIRAVKTVRLRMVHVEELLKRDPDLKVIHVLRDPRAVVRSRGGHESFRSLFSASYRLREAGIFCRQMYEDIVLKNELDIKYPNRIIQTEYNTLIKHLTEKSHEVLKFTGTQRSAKVEAWLKKNSVPPNKMKDVEFMDKWKSNKIDKWRLTIKGKDLRIVNRKCQQYFSIVKQAWPDTDV